MINKKPTAERFKELKLNYTHTYIHIKKERSKEVCKKNDWYNMHVQY